MPTTLSAIFTKFFNNHRRRTVKPSSPPIDSAQSSDHRLPHEVVDLIIDFLHNDRHTLATCAIVCRSWLPSSRYHLFSRVDLSLSDIEHFAKLFKRPKSTFPSYIQSLSLAGNASSAQQRAPYVGWTYLEGLDAVDSLYLRHIEREALQPLAHSKLLSSFHHLTRLDIAGIFCHSFDDVLDIICTYPHLRELSVSAIWWQVPGSQTFKQDLALPCLRTLHLPSPPAPLLEWLLARPSTLDVEALHMRRVPAIQSRLIGLFLRRLGSSLKHLEIGCPNPNGNHFTNPPPPSHGMHTRRSLARR